MLLGTTKVSLPNGNDFSRVHKYDRRHTYIQTDHAMVTSVTTDGTAFSNANSDTNNNVKANNNNSIFV